MVSGEPRGSCRVPKDHDEVLYVLNGRGEIIIADEAHRLHPGTAILLSNETNYTFRSLAEQDLEVISVCGPQTFPKQGTRRAVEVIDSHRRAAQDAVSDREFRVLFDDDVADVGMTQFLGYVPRVRTPRHVHPYSEMVCVVQGTGTVEISGMVRNVGVGSCYYLPEGIPHRVENTGEEFLVELGVFTPAGSPAQNSPVE
jgi:mannose-6-phosphate isomerase-like protein (cupin superfamily)